MRKFVVYIEWNYRVHNSPKDIYDNCIIYPLTKDFPMEYDGFNVVGGAGYDGLEINIYNDLETAIRNSGFKPEYIKFKHLSISERILKNKIIKKIKNVKV